MASHKTIIALLASSAALGATAQATVVSAATDGEHGPFDVKTLRDRPLDQLAQTAGPVDIRDRSDFVDNYADDVGNGVFFAPGVAVNALDIQEPRLSIRGFAVGNSQHRSNVKVLRDGAPLTDVHGTTHSTEIDLLSTEEIEIIRGVANLRDGGDNLGGAVKLVSRTGRTVAPGLVARADGGATIDGKPGGQGHVRLAGANGGMDYYAGVTGVYENGWRDNNRRTSQQFHGNLGFQLRDNISTRFYLDVVNSDTELAGTLTLADLEEDSQDPTPPITLGPLFPGGPIISLVDGARTDDFDRDVREGRIANETKLRFLWHDFTIGGHYTRREVDSAQIDFVGFIEEESAEWGARLEAERSLRAFGGEVLYRFGGDWTTGDQDSDRFDNDEGSAGDLNAETEQRSKVINAFVEGVYKPLQRLAVDVGAKLVKVEREVVDLSDDDLDSRDFTGVAARGGVLFDVTEAMQVYVSASRAYEPPSMEELTAGDPASLNGLDEQDSFTWEAGLRGSLGQWAGFNIAYFNTDVEGEIVSVAEPTSFITGDIFENTDKTSHKGVEAGLDLHLMRNRGSALTLRNVYTYANHRFVDGGDIDGVDGNRIGGLPVHHYRGEIRYDAEDVWFVAANVQLSGGDYFADHENTTMVPTEPVIGFSAGYRLNDRVEVFASGENVLDKAYVAGVSPVLTLDIAEDRIFAPGQRASVYGGLKYRF